MTAIINSLVDYKDRLVDRIFGPIEDFLQSKGICGGWVPVLVIALILNQPLRKILNRKTLDRNEKVWVVGWVALIVICAFMQIVMTTRGDKFQPFHA
jgi:hypothetical protein